MTLDAATRARLGELAKKATPEDALTVARYPHGGARIEVNHAGVEPDEGRELIADFYDEANREFYLAASPDAVLALLAENERLREALAAIADGDLAAERARAERWIRIATGLYEVAPEGAEVAREAFWNEYSGGLATALAAEPAATPPCATCGGRGHMIAEGFAGEAVRATPCPACTPREGV